MKENCKNTILGKGDYILITVTTLRTERSEFESRHEQGTFLFFKTSRPALGPNQPPIQ
jgi:hypothetical protein